MAASTGKTPKNPKQAKPAAKAAAGKKIISPRDPASGLPTGKRMHKPMTATM